MKPFSLSDRTNCIKGFIVITFLDEIYFAYDEVTLRHLILQQYLKMLNSVIKLS